MSLAQPYHGRLRIRLTSALTLHLRGYLPQITILIILPVSYPYTIDHALIRLIVQLMINWIVSCETFTVATAHLPD